MTTAHDFADALQRLETDRDLDAFLEVFAEQVELVRPEPGTSALGLDGARTYWQAYLDQFDTISSTFSRLAQDGQLAELEWVGTGRLKTGKDVSYAGCSLLVLDDEAKVVRFATYYDTSVFLLPHA